MTRFFAKGSFFHPDRKARFVPVEPPASDRTSADYPFTLNTGRIRDQWHTMTRTGKSARLSAHIAEPFAELTPEMRWKSVSVMPVWSKLKARRERSSCAR
ncbi:hypothetical protein AJ87_45015 [Rhizobium yanglingense]|nr:hypothetical protein AJ87_45015 [Rhizobium yanglingense]